MDSRFRGNDDAVECCHAEGANDDAVECRDAEEALI